MNGTYGVIIEFDNERGRWRVASEIRDGTTVSVKGVNLLALEHVISPQHLNNISETDDESSDEEEAAPENGGREDGEDE